MHILGSCSLRPSLSLTGRKIGQSGTPHSSDQPRKPMISGQRQTMPRAAPPRPNGRVEAREGGGQGETGNGRLSEKGCWEIEVIQRPVCTAPFARQQEDTSDRSHWSLRLGDSWRLLALSGCCPWGFPGGFLGVSSAHTDLSSRTFLTPRHKQLRLSTTDNAVASSKISICFCFRTLLSVLLRYWYIRYQRWQVRAKTKAKHPLRQMLRLLHLINTPRLRSSHHLFRGTLTMPSSASGLAVVSVHPAPKRST